ncbi:MAG: site-specific integrase [Tannerellaceae bacterium]|nr:site-specific integrase [Tannerellaceae bacterium]
MKNAFHGIASEQDTLVIYYEARIEQFLKNVGVNRCMETYKRYGISLAHLKRFMRKKYNVSDMSFQALTPSFVADYDYYLRVKLRFASQTIVNTIGQLRRIVKIAINNGLLRNDPFIDYEFITSPIVTKSLTSAELKKRMKTKLSRPNLNFIRDMFLFSSFTGIAFSDMRNLTEQNFSIAKDGVRWIHFKRKKTGTPCHISLLKIPLQLIEKYKGITKDDKLYPMISCSKTNIYLKRIAMECCIDKRVTFHMARHCYASVVTLSGSSVGNSSRITRSSGLESHPFYAEVSNEKIDEDMRHLNKCLSGKFHLAENNAAEENNKERRIK